MLNVCMYDLCCNRPLSRRLDRCDRVIQRDAKDPFGGNMYYVTMQITFFTRKFQNVQRNLHCDVVHITTKWVFRLTLACNGIFAIKASECVYDFAALNVYRTFMICVCVCADLCD